MQNHGGPQQAGIPGVAARTAEIIAPYGGLEGPAMPMLHAIQAAFGFVPEASVPVVADTLNLSRAEVHGLISFMIERDQPVHFRAREVQRVRHQPAGRNVVKLCRAEACKSMGADRLAAYTQERLGISWHETTADGAVTLEPIFCIGLCAAAPCGMVNDRSLARLDAGRIDQTLEACGR
jgi:formate dehydrogenase subunit gamma